MDSRLEGRNDAKVERVIRLCLASLLNPRLPVRYRLESDEGLHPDNIARYEREPGLDALARMLNYHFAHDTFAVIRKANIVQLCRVARGSECALICLVEQKE